MIVIHDNNDIIFLSVIFLIELQIIFQSTEAISMSWYVGINPAYNENKSTEAFEKKDDLDFKHEKLCTVIGSERREYLC